MPVPERKASSSPNDSASAEPGTLTCGTESEFHAVQPFRPTELTANPPDSPGWNRACRSIYGSAKVCVSGCAIRYAEMRNVPDQAEECGVSGV